MGKTPGETIATELSMVGAFGKNGQYRIGNTLDFLKFDEQTGVATIGDHKTTKGLYGASLAQQLSVERYSLEDILGQMRSYITDHGLTKANINEEDNLANFAKNFGLKDTGLASRLFSMANYGDNIIWRGTATRSTGDYAEGADIQLLSRD
jgi:hypothetical protein